MYLLNPAQGQYYGDIQQTDDGATAEYHGLLLSANHRLANHFTLNVDPGSRWSPKIHRVFRSAPDLTAIHESRHPFYLASVFEKRYAPNHFHLDV